MQCERNVHSADSTDQSEMSTERTPRFSTGQSGSPLSSSEGGQHASLFHLMGRQEHRLFQRRKEHLVGLRVRHGLDIILSIRPDKKLGLAARPDTHRHSQLVSGQFGPGHRPQRQISLVYDEAKVLKGGDGGAEGCCLIGCVEGAALASR